MGHAPHRTRRAAFQHRALYKTDYSTAILQAAPAEGMVEEKIASFGMRYDSIVQRAGEEYKATPPWDYYRDGYNLYQSIRTEGIRTGHCLKGRITYAGFIV